MRLLTFGTETSYDLTSEVTLRVHEAGTTYQPGAAYVAIRVQLGNAANPLAGGERVQVSVFLIMAAGDTCRLGPFLMDVPVGEDEIVMQLPPFATEAVDVVAVKALSNNSADSAVGAIVYLFDAAPLQSLVMGQVVDVDAIDKAVKMLINKAIQNKATGAIEYYDDDGETVILTHTPTDAESIITRAPS